MAAWWADVLGATLSPGPEGSKRWLRDVPGLPFDVWKFVQVPEPKTVKNRWHWDVVCDDVDALRRQGRDVLRRAGRRHRLARARRPGRQRVLRLRLGLGSGA